ncbi:MAG: GtrA family protein [Ruminococcaceae bacterium]|nr:GtrA family protein [Oscillospiraceae bacterium]
MNKLIHKYRDILLYLIFGVLTTAVDYLVFWPCYNLLCWPSVVSNTVSWTVAVLVAFLTNKPWVFHSHDWSWKTVWPEAVKFAGCRIGSWGIQTAILFLTVDLLAQNGNLMKIITSVLVIIINYVGSKFLVFIKKNKKYGCQ